MIEVLPELFQEIESVQMTEESEENDIRKVFTDVEFFLFVGQRLLDPNVEPEKEDKGRRTWESYHAKKPVAREYPTPQFCDSKEVEPCVASISHCQAPARIPFGVDPNSKDFSIFRPRGHYTKTDNSTVVTFSRCHGLVRLISLSSHTKK
eukprot:TRINITY_DN780_c0_g2_i1.p1 TRINITY_DN780_c0_g2~~TRINITY_DN780_c0_g2_i1.p1  ORF type:complete len:150 (+),score=26.74 TRINITY_DN780_c0_g2_i1:517-966(+)